MGKGVYDASEVARSVFQRVSDAVERDIASLCFESDEETLRQTQNAQIALYTVGVATFMAFTDEAETPPAVLAGHSVGEYSALASAGFLSIEEGARLVRLRGDLMAKAGKDRPGAMAAVLGLDDDAVDEVCRNCSRPGHVVVVANRNCPGQTVISGDAEAVEEAAEALKAAGAKRCLPLNVSGAFHSPLMAESAEEMGLALRSATFSKPASSVRLISNVTADVVEDPQSWPEMLERQLHSAVRWTESIRRAGALGIGLFLEFGPGEVLSGLVKRILPEPETLAIHGGSDLATAKQLVAGVPA